MILLFDIDGTLLSCGGAGRRALERAFEDLLGVTDALRGVRLAGSTDPQIIDDGLRSVVVSHGGPEVSTEQLLERYLDCLEEELAAAGPTYEVLPGVHEILETLAADPRFVLGLATGNVERGARLKLARGGLDHYFAFGGFGSDAKERSALVGRGVERGLSAAAQRGLALDRSQVLVFGDTEKDVVAAHAAGVAAVGVLAGSHHKDELLAAGPVFLAESFGSAPLWAWLGLSGPDPQRSKT